MKPLALMNLFDEFRADSWQGWRDVLERLTDAVREFYAVCGRGAGKSRIAALLAVSFALKDFDRAPGESVFVGVFAPDRRQARVTLGYVRGFLHARTELERLIEDEQKESITLSTGVVIEVLTASTSAPRGRTYALALIEEAAFLPQGDSANPDLELVRALRPALARCPGSLLCVISSPYARRGILWQAHQKHHDKPSERVLYVKAPTLDLNPSFDPETVEEALADDPEGARAEYLAEFRRDVETYVSIEAVNACVVDGRTELPPVKGVSHRAFVDPSGGSQDSYTLAIGHEENDVAVVDCIREIKAPFSPEAATAELAAVLRTYGATEVTGDRYGGEWPREAFQRHGIRYEPAPKAKSELYRDCLAVLNGCRVELPDHERLVSQIVSLERRTGRSGRDSIDHPPNGSDDLANALAGLVHLLLVVEQRPKITSLVWGYDDKPEPPKPSARPIYTFGHGGRPSPWVTTT